MVAWKRVVRSPLDAEVVGYKRVSVQSPPISSFEAEDLHGRERRRVHYQSDGLIALMNVLDLVAHNHRLLMRSGKQ